jgi:hypothetical protein
MDACRSIGASVCADEPLLERFGGLNLIIIDQSIAIGVPLVRRLLRPR